MTLESIDTSYLCKQMALAGCGLFASKSQIDALFRIGTYLEVMTVEEVAEYNERRILKPDIQARILGCLVDVWARLHRRE